MARQSLGEYLRHGQTPFFCLPTADFAARGADAFAGSDAVLLGVPFDGGTTYQPGARLGPYHLRRASALVQPYHPSLGFDVFERTKVVDGGNVPAPPFNAAAARELVELEVRAILDAGACPFVVGGDHSVALPCLRALAERHGPMALVHVDAHFDTSTAQMWGEAHHHGTPIRNAIEEGLVAPGFWFQVGLRGSWKDAEDAAFTRAHDGEVVTADDVASQDVAAIATRIRERLGDRPVYLSFDIDAVDPAFAPGTGTPVPGGLTSREALALVRGLGGLRLEGMDLVEVAPAFDHADITCLLGAHLLFEGLAVSAAATR